MNKKELYSMCHCHVNILAQSAILFCQQGSKTKEFRGYKRVYHKKYFWWDKTKLAHFTGKKHY
jgi:hypothetical protein